MLDIKKMFAIACCATVCTSALSACGKEKDKNEGDGFSISEVSPESLQSANTNNNGDLAEKPASPNLESELVQEEVSIAQEYDYYGLVYSLNEVVEYKFDQVDGSVLVVDLKITNNSEYEFVVGALANFEVRIDGEGKTTDFVTAQAMTLTARHFVAQGREYSVFGTSETPPIKPGETFTGYIPIVVESSNADFEKITVAFCPEGTAQAYNTLTATITPADIKTE